MTLMEQPSRRTRNEGDGERDRQLAVMPRVSDDWTVDDLETLPDDGLQYELLDGILLVSPAPIPVHQGVLVASYWIVDPAVPSIDAYGLVDGAYVDAGHASGTESVALQRPYPITITPGDLVDI